MYLTGRDESRRIGESVRGPRAVPFCRKSFCVGGGTSKIGPSFFDLRKHGTALRGPSTAPARQARVDRRRRARYSPGATLRCRANGPLVPLSRALPMRRKSVLLAVGVLVLAGLMVL